MKRRNANGPPSPGPLEHKSRTLNLEALSVTWDTQNHVFVFEEHIREIKIKEIPLTSLVETLLNMILLVLREKYVSSLYLHIRG